MWGLRGFAILGAVACLPGIPDTNALCKPPTGGGFNAIVRQVRNMYLMVIGSDKESKAKALASRADVLFSDFSKTWSMSKYLNIKSKDLPRVVELIKKRHPLATALQQMDAEMFDVSDVEENEVKFHYTTGTSKAVFGRLLHARAEAFGGEQQHNFMLGMFIVQGTHKTDITLDRVTVGKGSMTVQHESQHTLTPAEREMFEAYAEYTFANRAYREVQPGCATPELPEL